jgi:hypothetical protein
MLSPQFMKPPAGKPSLRRQHRQAMEPVVTYAVEGVRLGTLEARVATHTRHRSPALDLDLTP